MATKLKVKALVKHTYPAAQLAVLTKARKYGWLRSLSNVVNPEFPGQVAVVLTLQGTTAIVYPDGEMDRQSAQKDGRLYYRPGWSDPVAVAAAKAAAKRKEELVLAKLKELAEDYAVAQNINPKL